MSPESQDIIIYCTPWCGDCRTSKGILSKHNVPFVEKDVQTDPEAEQEFLALIGDGPHSVPRILFRQGDPENGMAIIETLVEPSPAALVQALQTHGYITAQEG